MEEKILDLSFGNTEHIEFNKLMILADSIREKVQAFLAGELNSNNGANQIELINQGEKNVLGILKKDLEKMNELIRLPEGNIPLELIDLCIKYIGVLSSSNLLSLGLTEELITFRSHNNLVNIRELRDNYFEYVILENNLLMLLLKYSRIVGDNELINFLVLRLNNNKIKSNIIISEV